MEDEKKLMIQKALIENTLNLARRKSESLDADVEERINKLLDRWNQINDKLKRLKSK